MKICLIGSGNLGGNLAKALFKSDIKIAQVISRNLSNAKSLAESINASYGDNVRDFDTSCDIIILSVPDNAIANICSEVDFGNRLLIHTAGSVDLSVFSKHKGDFGVFYPLQTFSKNHIINFTDIPVFVEGNNENVYQKLENLAKKISRKVYRANSKERLQLHIAAVFACNFTNHLFGIAHDLLENSEYGFQTLNPLIKETTRKALSGENPHKQQTGPALRNDTHTINKHLNELNADKSLLELYKFISNRIFETKKKHD